MSSDLCNLVPRCISLEKKHLCHQPRSLIWLVNENGPMPGASSYSREFFTQKRQPANSKREKWRENRGHVVIFFQNAKNLCARLGAWTKSEKIWCEIEFCFRFLWTNCNGEIRGSRAVTEAIGVWAHDEQTEHHCALCHTPWTHFGFDKFTQQWRPYLPSINSTLWRIMVEFGNLDGKKCLIALLVSCLQRLDEKWSI